MAIVYYISAHGFGHAVRSSTVIGQIPEEIPVIVRTEITPVLLREGISRSFRLEPESFDCGAVQSDGFTVDAAATLSRYSDIHLQNSRRLKEEVQFLQSAGAHLVVSDVASFPLVAASTAGIPGIALGNFTWADIYEPLVEGLPSYRSLLEEIRQEYSLATAGLKLPLSLPMADIPQLIDVPLVCGQGEPIRPALAGWLDIDPDLRWVLVYVGQFPLEFDWGRLASYAGWQFLVVGKESPASGIVALDPSRFSVPDMFASCDAVLGKPGYGTAADTIGAGLPFVYAMPMGFAESNILDTKLTEWGRAVRVDRETLLKGDVRPALEEAIQASVRVNYETNGAAVCAELIADAWRRQRSSSPDNDGQF